MAEEGTGGRGRGEREGRRKGPEREGEGRKWEGPMTLWHGAPQCLNPALGLTLLGKHNSVIFRCIKTKLCVTVYILSFNSCVKFHAKNLHALLKH